MAVKVSLKELLEAGAHFGHQSRRWDPKIEPYLYGVEKGVHVFDLTKTKAALEEALEVLEKTSKANKVILFVGTKKQAKEKIEEVAQATGCPYVNERWLGGTLTNFEQIQRSIKKLSKMKEKREAGEYKHFTKKERLLLDREIARLERFFGGIAELKDLPDLLVVVDIKREAGTIKEAQMKGITTMGIVDSNSNPAGINYPIPMNDDASKAISYVLSLMQEAIQEGKGKSKRKTGK